MVLQTYLIVFLFCFLLLIVTVSPVEGGRSRLHLIDLGGCANRTGGLPLSGIGNVLLAILSGQKHPPNRDHPLTPLLRDCLAPLTCHVAIVAHVAHSQVRLIDNFSSENYNLRMKFVILFEIISHSSDPHRHPDHDPAGVPHPSVAPAETSPPPACRPRRRSGRRVFRSPVGWLLRGSRSVQFGLFAGHRHLRRTLR